MDVSRSVWRVCLTAASSSTYFSWRQRPQHTLALGETPTRLRELWGGAWRSLGPCDVARAHEGLSLWTGLWTLRCSGFYRGGSGCLGAPGHSPAQSSLTHTVGAGPKWTPWIDGSMDESMYVSQESCGGWFWKRSLCPRDGCGAGDWGEGRTRTGPSQLCHLDPPNVPSSKAAKGKDGNPGGAPRGAGQHCWRSLRPFHAQHCAQRFTLLASLTPHKSSTWLFITDPISQMRK